MKTQKQWTAGWVLAVTGLMGGLACAQQGDNERMPPTPPPGMQPGMPPGAVPRGRGGDPMMDAFFPPELVMQNQKAIGLTEDQQKSIRAELQKSMGKFGDLQWQQSAEQQALAGLAAKERPDVKEVLAQLDKVMAVEAEMKRLQIGMLVTIKNTLSAEQAEKLRALRQLPGPRMGGEGRQAPPDGILRVPR